MKLRSLTILATLGLLAADALAGPAVGRLATITRVATDRVQAGGSLELRGEGLEALAGNAGLRLELDGALSEPGGAPEKRLLRLGARVERGGRVVAELDDGHIARLGARTLRFSGIVTLMAGNARLARLEGASFTLFPPDVQRVLAGYRVSQALYAATCKLGLELDHPDPAAWADRLEGGVEVVGVSDEAEQHGLKPGDRLLSLNRSRLDSWQALRLAALGADDRVVYDVKRAAGGRVKVELPVQGRGVPSWLLGILLISLVCGVVLAVIMVVAGYLTLAERRIAGRMQFRIGPNRVGPQGLIQWLADGLKLIQKEDLVPDAADPVLFRIAPYIVFSGMFLSLVAVPFSSTLIPQDLNVGILYILAVTSIVVVGILMGGWASNNKWSLLGGMRSAAQIVSYEVPATLAVLPVILVTGSLSMQAIILHQGGLPWQWNVFAQPALFLGFFITFAAGLAEGNRIPFDLPESESELVAGYNTEYSGFRFAVFFLGEFANIYVFGALMTTLFLGGWRLPTWGAALTEDLWYSWAPWLFAAMCVAGGLGAFVFAGAPFIWRGFHQGVGRFAKAAIVLCGVGAIAVGIGVQFRWGWPGWLGMEALRIGVFMSKALLIAGVIIWLRWTLPRLRIDQVMMICWKYLVPFAIFAFVFTAVWEVFVPQPVEDWLRFVWFAVGGVGLFLVFAKRVLQSFSDTDNPRYLNPFV